MVAGRRKRLRILRSMSILITGGAGYVGCHTARRLSELGRDIVVLTDSSGLPARMIELGWLEKLDKSA